MNDFKYLTLPSLLGKHIHSELLNHINRLNEIAEAMEKNSRCLGLLGLGSIGQETDRLDLWSDLDFFIIVEEGSKRDFIEKRLIIGECSEMDWCFKNTADGYKILWSDGVFGEMAYFEPGELSDISYGNGWFWWRRETLSAKLNEPVKALPEKTATTLAYQTGELLSCLYVGTTRFIRGEKLSAYRFVQTFCLDRFIEIYRILEPSSVTVDPWSYDRRFEQRHPEAETILNSILSGYERTPESVRQFLLWLDKTVQRYPESDWGDLAANKIFSIRIENLLNSLKNN
ncbi:MAG: hypothetical protein JXR86_00535 [Spirochaetales bacterium]|nr:hypothetical protein [Spirochaetales bacterium]